MEINSGRFSSERGTNPDLEILKSAFNLMAEEVGTRGKKLEEVVINLEARERYLETLLSSIRRGVVVLDTEGKIQRINKEALDLVMPLMAIGFFLGCLFGYAVGWFRGYESGNRDGGLEVADECQRALDIESGPVIVPAGGVYESKWINVDEQVDKLRKAGAA